MADNITETNCWYCSKPDHISANCPTGRSPERTYTKAEVALERAAVLREAAECTHTHGENATWKSGEASHRAICALILQADAHALESGKALERAAALRELAYRLERKSFPLTPHDTAEACVTLVDLQEECKAIVAEGSALEKLLAEARLDQTEKIRRQWVECVRFGEWLTDELAALRAAAGKVEP